MKLELTNDEIILSDGIMTYECRYDDVPVETLPMIIQHKKSLLQEINLNDMLTDLDNSSELIYIAYCALHGKKMQSDLDGLQFALLKLCAKNKVTMTTFRDQSQKITKEILSSYKWMKKGMVNQAKIIFESSAKYAGEMARVSHELSQEFDNLANQTTDVLKKTEVEHANEIQNKIDVENEIITMQAEKNKQDSLSKSLTEDLISVNAEYQDEKQALAKAEKKEMTMGIISAVTGAFSLGIGSAISAASKQKPGGVDQSKMNELSAQQQDQTTQQTKINTDKEAAQQRLDKYKTEIIDLQNELRIIQGQITNKKDLLAKETDETLKTTLQEEIKKLEMQETNMQAKITAKQKEIDDTESSLKDYTAQLSGIASALDSLTKSMQKMQEQAQSAIDSHSKKVSALLNKKLEMEKEKRESLAEMEKFAMLIQRNNNKKITTDTAIEMLVVAIRCLKKVASALVTAALFWESLKQYCEAMSKTTVTQLLDSAKDYTKEERIEFFTDPDFVLAIIEYASQWAAMYYVCDDYYKAANKTYQHTNSNFQSMPDEKQAMTIAQERSTAILSGISQQKRNSELESIEIKKQKEEFQSAMKAIEV